MCILGWLSCVEGWAFQGIERREVMTETHSSTTYSRSMEQKEEKCLPNDACGSS
jgi:hypothetical protein